MNNLGRPVSAVLYALQKNGLSLAITLIASALPLAWILIPETTNVQNVYERYIAHEETRPRVFEEGVNIKLDRDAPPVAALEEALRDQPWAATEKTPGFNVRPTDLRAQARTAEAMATKILADNHRIWSQQEERVLAAIAAERTRKAAMLQAAPYIAPNLQSIPKVFPQVPPRPTFAGAAKRGGASDVALTPRRVETLSEPSAPIVISQSKLGLSRDQILAALFLPLSTQLLPDSGATRPQTRPGSGEGLRPPGSNGGSSGRKPGAGAETYKPQTAAAFVAGDSSSKAPAGRQILIQGSIEFSGGMAMTDAKDRLVVLRESRGQFIESGAVWIREARYEIFVETLEGALVAELRSPHGEVIGRGFLDLGRVAVTPDQKRVEGLALKVNPISSGLVGRVQSAYSSSSATGSLQPSSKKPPAAIQGVIQGVRVEVDQAPIATRTDNKGHFEDHRLAEGSRVIARLSAPDHVQTLALLTAGHEAEVPLFSKKMIGAFKGIVRPPNETPGQEGIIWGRVRRAESSAEGARVEVLTEGADEPIYFNELMLPDPALKQTSSNGLFAISRAVHGAHVIRVHVGARHSDPLLLASESNSVTTVDLDLLRASEVPARAFDAFRPEWNLRTEVRTIGHSGTRKIIIDPDRSNSVRLAHLGQPVSLDVDAGPEYLRTRMIQNPDTRYLHIPVVQKAWFERVGSSLRYNASPDSGHVIGFVQGSRFRVALDDAALTQDSKVIYFDSRGEITNAKYGEAGGGFILLGVKEGLRTVVVQAEGSDRLYAATILVENGIVASISHWLR